MFFLGNILSDITAGTPSDQEILFGTFHMKNIFINFPIPILNHFFSRFHEKINGFHWFRLCYYAVFKHKLINIKIASKKHEIFNEIEQKS